METGSRLANRFNGAGRRCLALPFFGQLGGLGQGPPFHGGIGLGIRYMKDWLPITLGIIGTVTGVAGFSLSLWRELRDSGKTKRPLLIALGKTEAVFSSEVGVLLGLELIFKNPSSEPRTLFDLSLDASPDWKCEVVDGISSGIHENTLFRVDGMPRRIDLRPGEALDLPLQVSADNIQRGWVVIHARPMKLLLGGTPRIPIVVTVHETPTRHGGGADVKKRISTAKFEIEVAQTK